MMEGCVRPTGEAITNDMARKCKLLGNWEVDPVQHPKRSFLRPCKVPCHPCNPFHGLPGLSTVGFGFGVDFGLGLL